MPLTRMSRLVIFLTHLIPWSSCSLGNWGFNLVERNTQYIHETSQQLAFICLFVMGRNRAMV